MVSIEEEVVQALGQMAERIGTAVLSEIMSRIPDMADTQKELLLLLINTLKNSREGKIKLPENGEIAIEKLIASASPDNPMKQIKVSVKDYDDFSRCLNEEKALFASFSDGDTRFIYFPSSCTEKVEKAEKRFAEIIKSRVSAKENPEKPALDDFIIKAKADAAEINDKDKDKTDTKKEYSMGGE